MTNSVAIILITTEPGGRKGLTGQTSSHAKKHLLIKLVEQAKASMAENIIVVTDDASDKLKEVLIGKEVRVLFNNDWKEGTASFIRHGLKELQKINPGIDAFILVTPGNHEASSNLFDKLITAHRQTGKPIVTCTYNEKPGPPALFHQSMFPELMQLIEDNGPAKIVEIHMGNTICIPVISETAVKKNQQSIT